MKKKKHEHYWFTPGSVWQGFKKNQSLIARYCHCGEIQIATTSAWKKADKKTKIYPDVIEACKESMHN